MGSLLLESPKSKVLVFLLFCFLTHHSILTYYRKSVRFDFLIQAFQRIIIRPCVWRENIIMAVTDEDALLTLQSCERKKKEMGCMVLLLVSVAFHINNWCTFKLSSFGLLCSTGHQKGASHSVRNFLCFVFLLFCRLHLFLTRNRTEYTYWCPKGILLTFFIFLFTGRDWKCKFAMQNILQVMTVKLAHTFVIK